MENQRESRPPAAGCSPGDVTSACGDGIVALAETAAVVEDTFAEPPLLLWLGLLRHLSNDSRCLALVSVLRSCELRPPVDVTLRSLHSSSSDDRSWSRRTTSPPPPSSSTAAGAAPPLPAAVAPAVLVAVFVAVPNGDEDELVVECVRPQLLSSCTGDSISGAVRRRPVENPRLVALRPPSSDVRLRGAASPALFGAAAAAAAAADDDDDGDGPTAARASNVLAAVAAAGRCWRNLARTLADADELSNWLLGCGSWWQDS